MAGQHFGLRAADPDRQGLLGHGAEAGDAGFMVKRPDAALAARAGGEQFVGHSGRQFATDRAIRGGPDDPVPAGQQNDALGPHVDGAVEIGQILGVQRQHQHAVEAAVGAVQAPGHLDRPAAGGAAQHRLADEQAGAGLVLVDAEMVAVGQVYGGETGDGAVLQHAVRADDGQLERHVAQDRRARRHGGKAEAGGIALVLGFHIEQRLVQPGEGAMDVFVEGARQIGGIGLGLRQQAVAFAPQVPGQGQPQQQQDENAERRDGAPCIHPGKYRTRHGCPLVVDRRRLAFAFRQKPDAHPMAATAVPSS
ncbi:MAG: hypothetical protein NVV74_12325 [Magnetospirillum sp.]|nr:hypothetical protein [Magnetospirillum sp.]